MPEPLILPFASPLLPARFLGRRRRFLADVERDGERFVAHTNNSGAMLGLLRPGRTVWLSRSDNPRRALAHTLELVDLDGLLVGVNTLTPNRLLAALARQGRLAELLPETAGYDRFQAEAKSPLAPDPQGRDEPLSRLDCRLSCPEGDLWIEAKNVTLVEDGGVAAFPDAVTERGQKHLRELTRLARLPRTRAAVFFAVQRADGRCFAPADYVDPVYARLFWEAVEAGVEMWPCRVAVSPAGVALGGRLPLARPDGETNRAGRGGRRS